MRCVAFMFGMMAVQASVWAGATPDAVKPIIILAPHCRYEVRDGKIVGVRGRCIFSGCRIRREGNGGETTLVLWRPFVSVNDGELSGAYSLSEDFNGKAGVEDEILETVVFGVSNPESLEGKEGVINALIEFGRNTTPHAYFSSKSKACVEVIWTNPAWFKTWTALSGHTVEAELVGFKEKAVVLKKRNGSTVTPPIKKLIKPDQDYVKRLQSLPLGTSVDLSSDKIIPEEFVGKPIGSEWTNERIRVVHGLRVNGPLARQTAPTKGCVFLCVTCQMDGDRTLATDKYKVVDTAGNSYVPLGFTPLKKKPNEAQDFISTEDLLSQSLRLTHGSTSAFGLHEGRISSWVLTAQQISFLYELPEKSGALNLKYGTKSYTLRPETAPSSAKPN